VSPSSAVAGPSKVTFGATFVTETLFESEPRPVSSSVTLADTVTVPAPESSDHVQSNEPLFDAGVKTTAEAVPFVPQLTELPAAGNVSAVPGSVHEYV